MIFKHTTRAFAILAMLGAACPAGAGQQTPPVERTQVPAVRPATTPPASKPVDRPRPPEGVAPPADYVIGPDDVLIVMFWREKDLSVEATVRPDGKITLPLLNDVQAAGLTPDQLRDRITEQAKRYLEDPNPTILVKEIRSRRVFITGQVAKPGAYPINDRMTVLQLIALAGGLTEFAREKEIVIMRPDSLGAVRPAGQPVSFLFNYKDVVARRNLKQNIELRSGDTVIVP